MERKRETALVRELAKRVTEIAVSEKHVRMRERFRRSNDLEMVRPPLNIEEIPWQQMNLDHALDCVCEDPELREMEFSFRMCLFREKYLCCDNYIEPFWPVFKIRNVTGNGLVAEEDAVNIENTYIHAHGYHDVLADESALENFRMPTVTADPAGDAANVAHKQEILGDAMPVILRGHGIYYSPWDVITTLRGVEPIMIDMYERPEYLHRIIRLFADAMKSEMDQTEALGLYDGGQISLHCTPYAVTVPHPSAKGNTAGDQWFRTMAQTFSSVSPAAHREFDMEYSAPLAKRCAYTYYGCCEPLHDRIDQLKACYPNLRKVGCSPWANVEATAEQLGGGYVLSRKPNPAAVAIRTDPEAVRKEIEETVKLCLKYGCPCDITLKDISTVNNRPGNLIEWARAASEVLDAYYGE